MTSTVTLGALWSWLKDAPHCWQNSEPSGISAEQEGHLIMLSSRDSLREKRLENLSNRTEVTTALCMVPNNSTTHSAELQIPQNPTNERLGRTSSRASQGKRAQFRKTSARQTKSRKTSARQTGTIPKDVRCPRPAIPTYVEGSC